ncbi:MAG TPA: NlpC/P60 family protein [Ferruginibacter sp.]|jgi:lipoprotein Spr|nr:NlpC/P60 family protein [Ferruginibacter sp.]
MKNLFFVSVAIGILSGTMLPARAQSSVNVEQVNGGSQKRSVKFIDGIEIKAGTTVADKTVISRSTSPEFQHPKQEESTAIESFTSLQFKYAQLLDIEVEQATNKTLFAEIDKWWGTRYKYGGASESGMDCSAYTGTLVHNVYGIVLPRTSRDQYEDCIKLDKNELQQGDLVFFRTGRRGVSHVGLYLGNGYFTHASTSIGVTISNLSETYWTNAFVSGGRINVPATASN